MEHRNFLRMVLLGVVGIGVLFGWRFFRGPNLDSRDDSDDWERRVIFVCCDDHGNYSPGIYMRMGGGRAAFETVREAAPFLRAGDPASSAAGLCGYLFKRIGYDGETAGTLALEPSPQPGSDGTINWEAYAGDGDVILINVDKRSAKCCFGSMLGEEVHDLPPARHKIEPH